MQTRKVLALLLSALAATLAWSAPKDGAFPEDSQRIRAIFAAHDRLQPGLEEYMGHVADDLILMPNGGPLVEGKAAYLQHVKDFYAAGTIQIRHELVEAYSYPEVVIARGRAVGTFTPPGGTASAFETRNMFVFRRLKDGSLKVWQIIFNNVPAGT
jgi:ketosteroid isomerase-like protein